MIRLLVLLLTVLTGFSGLVYEVTWQRYLATLLGSHSEATAAVLGLFLGGLALGYSIFGSLTQRLVERAQQQGRSAPLLTFYGAVEASIGVFALAFPWLFAAVQALSFRIPHGSAGFGFALDVGLSALLVLPPAVLMGGTIPILTQALARSLEDATRFHALVYAFNTAGAFAGALAAGYWLVPSLGLVKVLVWMGGINLVAGAIFLAIGQLRPQAALPAAAPSSDVSLRGTGWASFAAVALLTGFAMMTLQTVLIRLGGVSFGSSQFTFSMVVAVFVLCIAIGSFAVSALPRIPAFLLPACLWTLLLLLAGLYVVADTGPYWAYVLRTLFENQDAAFYPYFFSAFAGLLAVIGIPVALSGAVLPLMFHALRERVGDLGAAAGRLYSWNTLGSLLGALIGGYVLLFWLDLHHTFRIAMAGVAVAAALMTVQRAWLGRAANAALLAAALLVIAALPAWRPERLNAGLFQSPTGIPQILPATYSGPGPFFDEHPLTRPRELGGQYAWIFHDDDPTSSVTVTEKTGKRGRRELDLRNNGRPEGGTEGSDKTMRLAALLPALFADKMERAFVVGYGLGMTAGELASLSTMREVVVAEISPGVIEAAPLFDPENGGASQQPSVKIVNSDAYRALLRSDTDFDAIISIPSHTWVAGVEMLFSREFLEAARNRLTPGGVYLQWLYTNGLESDLAEPTALALRTFASVFPAVAVWYGHGFELLIVGMQDERGGLDLDRIDRLSRRRDVAAGLARAEIPDLPSLLAHELLPLGVVSAARLPGPLHTLLHPQLGNLAARAFFTGGEGVLPATAELEAGRIGSRNSLQRRFAARYGGRLPESERGHLVAQLCLHRPRECQTQLAAWIRDVPESETREIVLRTLREGTRGRINPVFVPSLLPLFGLAPQQLSPVTPDEAERSTDVFVRYYTHATPFPRHVLSDLWRRCAADPAHPDACREGRAAAELRLGSLDAQLAESPEAAVQAP